VRKVRANHGFTIQSYAQDQKARFDGDEDSDPNDRPGFIVTYFEGQLAFATAAQSLALNTPSKPMRLTRQRLDGVGIGAGLPPLTVTLSSSSSTGGFSAAGATTFTPTLKVSFAQDAITSDAFLYRDSVDGSPVLSADAPPAWRKGTQVETVGGGSTTGPAAVIVPAVQTLDPGSAASLDGSGSRPSTSAKLNAYRWTLLEGPTGVELQANAPQQSLTLTEPGDYVVQLTVQDDAQATSGPATAKITVTGSVFHPAGRMGCGCGADGNAGLIALAALALLGLARGPRARRLAARTGQPQLRGPLSSRRR
jgi:hypothetical protein